MKKPIIRINDGHDEVIDREMTDEEFATWTKQNQDSATQWLAREKAQEQAVTDKAALLTKLGITADEFASLL